MPLDEFHRNLPNAELDGKGNNLFPINDGIYALELEQGKYYVGQSSNIKRRVTNHSSSWTDEYKPIRVDGVFSPEEDKTKLEKEVTLLYMKQYGYENVRGGPWTWKELDNPPKAIRD